MLLSLGLCLLGACTHDFCGEADCKAQKIPTGLAIGASCKLDRSCDDGLSCNGAERCQKQRCVAGEAKACEVPGKCEERKGAAACVYPADARWLVYQSDSGHSVNLDATFEGFTGYIDLLTILPLADGSMKSISLAKAVLRDGDLGASVPLWAPDGRFVIFSVTDTFEFSANYEHVRTFWVPFDDTGPGRARLIDNLPTDEDFVEVQALSRDSHFLITSSLTRTYLSRFEGETTRTTLLAQHPHTFASSYAFCADNRHAVRQSDELGAPPRAIVDISAGKDTTKLGGESWHVSPDGQWIANVTNGKLQVGACAITPALVTVPLDLGAPEIKLTSPPEWSSDSRFLLLEARDDNAGYALLVSWDGKARRGRQVFLGSSPGTEEWSPSGHGLLMSPSFGADSSLYAYVDPSEAKPSAKPIDTPESSTASWASETGFWVERQDEPGNEKTASKLWFVSTSDVAHARLVNSHVTDRLHDAAKKRIFYVINDGSGHCDIALADLSGAQVKTNKLVSKQRGEWHLAGFLPGDQFLFAEQVINDESAIGRPGLMWRLGIDGSLTAIGNGDHEFSGLQGLQPAH